MRAVGVEPNVISFSAAISACEKGGQWERALGLLGEMRAVGVEPDVISFNAVIQACATAVQPASALEVFRAASDAVDLDIGTFNAVLDAVCTPQPAEARALWLQGVELGHYVNFEQQEVGLPKLDLHNLSEGAAETAVRWWLNERVPAMSAAPERLIIVTGWGKSRSMLRDGDVRGRVERVLGGLGVSTLPTGNKGRFLVDARGWRRDGLASVRDSMEEAGQAADGEVEPSAKCVASDEEMQRVREAGSAAGFEVKEKAARLFVEKQELLIANGTSIVDCARAGGTNVIFQKDVKAVIARLTKSANQK
jgi:pentatricopeptide repeat protein